MRILLVNKFIFPKGGAETYTFDVGKMLEEHGHEVQYFGLENEKNTVGNRIGSYVTNMDFSQGIRANLNAPFRIIYSREARKKIRRNDRQRLELQRHYHQNPPERPSHFFFLPCSDNGNKPITSFFITLEFVEAGACG